MRGARLGSPRVVEDAHDYGALGDEGDELHAAAAAPTAQACFQRPADCASSLQGWGQANAGASLLISPLPARPALTGVSSIWLTTATHNVSATKLPPTLRARSFDFDGFRCYV